MTYIMIFFYIIRDILLQHISYILQHVANHDFHGIPSKYNVIKEVQSVPVDLKKS